MCEGLADFWKTRSECDRLIEQAVMRADVKAANIVVMAALVAEDSSKMNEAALMLMECDSGATLVLTGYELVRERRSQAAGLFVACGSFSCSFQC